MVSPDASADARFPRCSVRTTRAIVDVGLLLQKLNRLVILAHRLVHISQATIGARGAVRIQFDRSVEMNDGFVIPARGREPCQRMTEW